MAYGVKIIYRFIFLFILLQQHPVKFYHVCQQQFKQIEWKIISINYILMKSPRVRPHAAIENSQDEDTTESGSSDSGRWNPYSESDITRGTIRRRSHVTKLGDRSRSKSRSRGHHDPATGGKSAPASFRSPAKATATADQSMDCTIALGLKMAQNQAFAVAGFIDSQKERVCASCLSRRASYHGKGDYSAHINLLRSYITTQIKYTTAVYCFNKQSKTRIQIMFYQ